jgi:S1-C subfamily serine protease
MTMKFPSVMPRGVVARLLLAATICVLAGNFSRGDDEGFVPIFDADHTEGWQQLGAGEVKVGPGVMTVATKRAMSGVYWYRSKAFGDFTLKLEFRVENKNSKSGIYVRFADPEGDYRAPSQTAYKINVSEHDTGGIIIPQSEAHPIHAVPAPHQQWNDCEVTVVGQHYTVKVNGETVNDFTGNRALNGFIALQILKGSPPVHYRNIRIKEFPSESAPASRVAATPKPTEGTPSTAPAIPDPALSDSADLVKTYRNSLVFVTNGEGAGTNKVLFTNAHVAAGVRDATYRTLNGTEIKLGPGACAIGRDVVLFEAPNADKPLEVMKEVDGNATIGDQIVVLGNAEGAGVINTITGRIVGIGPDLVEIDAPFQPGNSGSPIIHLKSGKVIGVATYAIVRNADTLTGKSTSTPKVRRFGYRLDTVKNWQQIDWKAFTPQAVEMEAIEKRTSDIGAFLIDLSKNQPLGTHDNPAIRERIVAWLRARSKPGPPRDKTFADESLRSFINDTCQSDVKIARQSVSYDYFKRQLSDQQRARDQLCQAFGDMIARVRFVKK